MPEILPTFESMRVEQKSSFAQMRIDQNAWKPPTPEEEAITEDWTLPAAIAVGGAAGILGGATIGAVTGTSELAIDLGSQYLGKIASQVHPSLEVPTYIGAGVLSAFTIQSWFIKGTTKALTTKIPKFWSKEFTLANKKGMLSKQFMDDHLDIINRMDMGDKKATEQMLNIFKQNAYQERMIAAGKRLEKLSDTKVAEPVEKVEKVVKQLSKKKFLDDRDYQRLARIAKVDAVKEYTSQFTKNRTNIINKAANAKWQSHEMKDVIDTLIKEGGISPKYKFASSELQEAFWKRHPNLKVTKTVSANVEKIAGDFGYTNVDDMIFDIFKTPNQKTFRRIASAELAPEFNRIYRDEILLRIAEKEADYLFKLHKISRGFEEGKLLKLKHVEALRRASDTLPARLVIQEVTSLKKATSQLLKVIQKSKLDKTRLLRLQTVYDGKLAEYQAAVKIKKELGLINSRLKHVTGVQGEYKEQLQNLLAPLFKRSSKKLDKSLFTFLTGKCNDEVSIGADILIKKYDGLLKTFPFRSHNFMELTYTQAKDLDEFVKVFKFVAQNDKYITDQAEKVILAVIAKEIHDTATTTISKIKLFRPRMTDTQLAELAKSQAGGLVRARRSAADVSTGVLASLKRIEAICYQLDGFKTGGRAWRTIFNKTIKAEIAKERLGRRVFGSYEKIFAAHKAATKIRPDKYWSATSGNLVGYPIRKEFAFIMACNSKNTANTKAMLEGLGISEKELSGFLNQALNKADWKLVDDVLDFLDETFPLIAKVHKEKTGLTLQKVKGRYFPILSDRKFAKIKQPLEDLFFDPSTELFRARVKKTFTEFRHGGVKAVRLDFNGLTQHIADVVHYTTHWGPLSEIQRLTRSSMFQEAVETTMGKDIYRQFDPWLKNLARPSRTEIDKWMGKARRNVTFANLALVPLIAVKQGLSFITAMPKVGYINAMGSLARFMLDPSSMLKAIKEASPEMAYRSKTWNRDFIEMMSEIKPTGTKNRLQRIGYYMIHKVDEITASVVWYAGYIKGLAKFRGNGDLAVAYANKAVRSTQPASAPKDIPLIMRSGEGYRALTMFYSYWSVFHGQVAEVISKGLAKHITPSQVAGTLAWITIAPAVTQHLARSAWNSLTGREQEEEHAKEIAKGTALNAVAALPVARDISAAVVKGYSYQLSPVVDVPVKTVSVGDAIAKIFDEDEELNMYDLQAATKLGSYLRIFPSRAMITAVTGGLRIYEGETEDWTEIIERPAYEKK